jgi:phage shock protein E
MKIIASALLMLMALFSLPALAAESISAKTLAAQIKDGKAPLIIDVRSEDDFLAGRIPGARLIPHDEIGNYVDSLAAHKDEPILLYHDTSPHSGEAAKVLEKAGFRNIQRLEGDFPSWQAGGHPVQK